MAPTLRKRKQGPDKQIPAQVEAARPPRRKQRLTQAIPSQGLEGPSSAALMDVPFDIFFEIFRHLSPKDLLNLILTNKLLRATLTHRSMDVVWRQARKGSANLPVCPPYLREHHYTDLIFGHHCHQCGANGPEVKATFEFSARYCHDCQRDMIVEKPYNTSQPHFDLCVPLRNQTSSMGIYHKPEVNRMKVLWQQARTGEEQAALITLRNTFLDQHADHVDACQRYIQVQENIYRARQQRLKDDRIHSICRRLDTLGFDTEILCSKTQLNALPMVGVAERLTDADWEKMKPKLVVFMTERKECRLKWQRVHAMKARLASLTASLKKARMSLEEYDALPHAADLISFTEIRTIVELPDSVHIPGEAFDQILPDLSERWQKDVLARLKTKFPDIASTSCRRKAVPFQDLAKTAFQCSSCRRVLFWPMVASHYHSPKTIRPNNYAFGPWRTDYPPLKIPVFDAAVQGEFRNRKQWTTAPIRLYREQAVQVINACEMNPDTVSIAEMDEQDARISCRLCGVPGESKLVMSWRAAMSHCLTAHRSQPVSEIQWDQISAAQEKRVRSLEKTRRYKSLTEYNAQPACCALCNYGTSSAYSAPTSIADVQNHLRVSHAGNSDPKAIYITKDTPPFVPLAVRLYSNAVTSTVKADYQVLALFKDKLACSVAKLD